MVWYNIVYISDLRCLLGQVVVVVRFGGIWCVLRCGADFAVIVFDWCRLAGCGLF